MKCGNGIPAPARVSYIWRVRLATKSLFPPEMAKNTPSETRASRIANSSHRRFPRSTDRINPQGSIGWGFRVVFSLLKLLREITCAMAPELQRGANHKSVVRLSENEKRKYY